MFQLHIDLVFARVHCYFVLYLSDLISQDQYRITLKLAQSPEIFRGTDVSLKARQSDCRACMRGCCERRGSSGKYRG